MAIFYFFFFLKGSSLKQKHYKLFSKHRGRTWFHSPEPLALATEWAAKFANRRTNENFTSLVDIARDQHSSIIRPKPLGLEKFSIKAWKTWRLSISIITQGNCSLLIQVRASLMLRTSASSEPKIPRKHSLFCHKFTNKVTDYTPNTELSLSIKYDSINITL